MKNLKKAVLMIATGFTTGVVFASSLITLNLRRVSVGGEVLFVPMVVLLIWFGWMLHSEARKAGIRRFKNGNPRRK